MIKMVLWLPIVILMMLGISPFRVQIAHNWLNLWRGNKGGDEQEPLTDRVFNSLSHELLTPLTAIRGCNDILRMMATDNLDERQMEFIEYIGQNADDLLGIIQKILDLAQLENGSIGLDWAPVELTKLVEEEARAWRERMDEHALSFAVHLKEKPIWVEGDYARLSRVVRNLIENAHKYTLPGGKIDVYVNRRNGHTQVDIKDTGVGIAQADQENLFRRYYKAVQDDRMFEASGAGLGLYLSKAIVEEHKGEIWLSSEPNRGSTFSFTLPVRSDL